MAERRSCRTADAAHRKQPPPIKVEGSRTYVHFIFPSLLLRAKQCKLFQVKTRPPGGRILGMGQAVDVLYLSTGGVAGAGPRRGSLG